MRNFQFLFKEVNLFIPSDAISLKAEAKLRNLQREALFLYY